ncbi:hypothetical protein [Methylobacterium gregans]|uniref:Uncharacterized protein n=1 Tax=Methylobacterium gregans TaxID=374424 RepID=A0AA37MAU3_9HYPH|nr:hypothetical protein [Methylobacterium gregans]MDQ0521983.1 hypothetical protein [Methylobacterium gregans]GJD77984.1 hypothetical protein NBEOAGPD_1196 [Methylobacterium gregans]GLS51953.1 hypothetical protein GCM10007886_01350 [Methylobacterium gregans]
MGRVIHGHSPEGRPSPEYRAYAAMKNRCLNRNQARYKDYGARGIGICSRWLHGDGELTGFQCFLVDMGTKPSPGHSLERRRNQDGYGPDNCVWATRTEQARNTRGGRIIDVCDHPMLLVEAVERWGAVSYDTTSMRLHRGWSAHDALFVPKGGKPGDADLMLYGVSAEVTA